MIISGANRCDSLAFLYGVHGVMEQTIVEAPQLQQGSHISVLSLRVIWVVSFTIYKRMRCTTDRTLWILCVQR